MEQKRTPQIIHSYWHLFAFLSFCSLFIFLQLCVLYLQIICTAVSMFSQSNDANHQKSKFLILFSFSFGLSRNETSGKCSPGCDSQVSLVTWLFSVRISAQENKEYKKKKKQNVGQRRTNKYCWCWCTRGSWWLTQSRWGGAFEELGKWEGQEVKIGAGESGRISNERKVWGKVEGQAATRMDSNRGLRSDWLQERIKTKIE